MREFWGKWSFEITEIIVGVMCAVYIGLGAYQLGYRNGVSHTTFMEVDREAMERKPIKSETPPGITIRNSYFEANSDVSKIVIGAETLKDVARVYAVLRARVQNDPEMDQACKTELLRQLDKSQQFQLEHVKVTK